MFVKFVKSEDLRAEVRKHVGEVETTNGVAGSPPVVRVQPFVHARPVMDGATNLLTFIVEVGTKRLNGDVLICREKIGSVDHWGKEFASEKTRLELVEKLEVRAGEIREMFGFADVREGRFVEDPGQI